MFDFSPLSALLEMTDEPPPRGAVMEESREWRNDMEGGNSYHGEYGSHFGYGDDISGK